MITALRSPVVHAAAHAHPSHAHKLTAADLKTAHALKGSINSLMMRVRVGLTPAAQQPKLDPKTNVFVAPNGHKLFDFPLETPPRGSADMFGRTALVDPVSNTFYVLTTGGFAGVRNFNGPLALPADAQFKQKVYTLTELRQLARAAK
jgi:hypothetical protein